MQNMIKGIRQAIIADPVGMLVPTIGMTLVTIAIIVWMQSGQP